MFYINKTTSHSVLSHPSTVNRSHLISVGKMPPDIYINEGQNELLRIIDKNSKEIKFTMDGRNWLCLHEITLAII